MSTSNKASDSNLVNGFTPYSNCATKRFSEIYDSTSKSILSFIISKCGKTTDINDIFQDTYFELYQLLTKRGTDYITNEKALVFRIARRKIARYYSLSERLKLFKSLNSTVESNENGEEIIVDYEDMSLSVEDSVVNQVMLNNAQEFINSKPEDVKKVFALFYDLNHTIPEIARALSMSESNVKQKLYRTLKELRKLLNEE
jgi:RNA polymerase sigma-70 factor (ECF subfamily)